MWLEREEAEVHKVFDLPSGNKIHFKQYPPHGLWKMSFERGTLPANLTGAYTSFAAAQTAWKTYYNATPHLQVPPPAQRLKEALAD